LFSAFNGLFIYDSCPTIGWSGQRRLTSQKIPHFSEGHTFPIFTAVFVPYFGAYFAAFESKPLAIP
jgi:hypothetical protein